MPPVGLGCMCMSKFYGETNEKNNLSVLSKAIDLDCRFWDAADMYGPFSNEKLIGKALVGKRKKITLATKFGIKRDNYGNWF